MKVTTAKQQIKMMLVTRPALDPLDLDGIFPNNEQFWSLTHS